MSPGQQDPLRDGIGAALVLAVAFLGFGGMCLLMAYAVKVLIS